MILLVPLPPPKRAKIENGREHEKPTLVLIDLLISGAWDSVSVVLFPFAACALPALSSFVLSCVHEKNSKAMYHMFIDCSSLAGPFRPFAAD